VLGERVKEIFIGELETDFHHGRANESISRQNNDNCGVGTRK